MRKELSRAERTVWRLVRGGRLGAKFRRQHLVGSYIADFACIEVKLIVEVDGLSHQDEAQRAHDAERTRLLGEAGWRVLRLRDDDVLSDSGRAERAIRDALVA